MRKDFLTLQGISFLTPLCSKICSEISFIKNFASKALISYKRQNNLLALTRYSGFFNVLPANKISIWNSYLNELDQVTVYSSLINKEGFFSIGTVKKGLIKLDQNGNLVDLLNKQNSIINNTVLSVFEDKNLNLLSLNSAQTFYSVLLHGISLRQSGGPADLSLLFKFTRSWCYNIHKNRLKLKGWWYK